MSEYSSKDLASLASRALRDPGSLTLDEIQSLAASVLTQSRPKKFKWPWSKKAS